jgi:RND family efflux transporter MFP subunit
VVEIAVASLAALPRTVEVVGTIEPWRQVSPGTRLLGRVAEVRAREGERVERGEALVRLERGAFEAARDEARAAVAMAEAELANAGAQHRRMQDLHARGSVTDKNLEDATARHRIAVAALEQERAKLAAAEVDLADTEIAAPVTGWVTARLAEPGDIATPGAALFRIEDLSRVKVALAVPESEVAGLRVGDPLRVHVDALQRDWDATVHRIVPAGDRSTRTYEVQLVLDNADGQLKSAMFARASFHRGERQALHVPLSAVIDRGQLRGVFVVDGDGRARLRWIRLGRADGERVDVLSGLAPGERYVVAPPPSLEDGSRVGPS